MKVHYIAEYALKDNKNNLSFSPAGITKMNYIISALIKVGAEVCVYSTSRTLNKKGFYGSFCEKEKTVKVKHRATFGYSNSVIHQAEILFSKLQLFYYLLFCVKAGETVVMYHERYYLPILRLIKFFRKKLKIIYEVEELYTVAAGYDAKTVEKEKKGILFADSYIFSNTLLPDLLKIGSKPYTVIHGVYKPAVIKNKKYSDGKVHVVYAGTFDIRKNSAFIALKSTLFLDDNYVFHILGFGNEESVIAIKKLLEEISAKTQCEIRDEGCLIGDEYENFLQKCDIGISPQQFDAAFNDTSFPSKLLTYLGNGLTAVVPEIKVLTQSKISDYLNYYEAEKPELIAEAVKKADLSKSKKSIDYMRTLDDEFCSELLLLIEK